VRWPRDFPTIELRMVHGLGRMEALAQFAAKGGSHTRERTAHGHPGSSRECSLGPERISVHPPNGWLIGCKRPVKTYGPLSLLGGWHAGGAGLRPRLSAALAG
jgi:hypothetical protein